MNIKKTLGYLSIAFFLFASCKIEPIFYAIENEVPLEKAVIKGNLYAMTEFKGNLYAASGKLYVKKTTDIRGWSSASSPSGHIIRVASDENNLYVLTNDKKLYTSINGKNWNLIDIPDIKELFDNKAEGADKLAYITTEDAILILDGALVPSDVPAGASEKSKAAAFDGSNTVFSENLLIAAGSQGIYTVVDDKVVFGESSYTTVEDCFSMAVYDDGEKEILILGTDSGITCIGLGNDGKPQGTISPIGQNADSSLALLEILTIYTFKDSVYAFGLDTNTTKKTKTWGYYTSRPEWNVE